MNADFNKISQRIENQKNAVVIKQAKQIETVKNIFKNK